MTAGRRLGIASLLPHRNSERRLEDVLDVENRYQLSIDQITPSSISVIIPVKDNQPGLDRLLDALRTNVHPPSRPREVIVVDNESVEPVVLDGRHSIPGMPVRLLHCPRPGAGAARNVGAAAAQGTWLLFTDSDCIPTSTFISGYVDASRGAIAYAGLVRGTPPGRALTQFYDQEGVLLPYFIDNVSGDPAPLYIITANALVWKRAFDACGGFSELFHEAGGEDVELSVRLWRIGSLECAYGSVVMHDFSDGYRGFWRRFVRYGSGNRVVEATTGIAMRPLYCRPSIPTLYNLCAKQLQYGALRFGYRRSRSRKRGYLPPAT